jgi:hypothetical protein
LLSIRPAFPPHPSFSRKNFIFGHVSEKPVLRQLARGIADPTG